VRLYGSTFFQLLVIVSRERKPFRTGIQANKSGSGRIVQNCVSESLILDLSFLLLVPDA
jgi:hypothetical protein